MRKLLLLIFLAITFSARAQIATGLNALQASPWRTFSNPNMVGIIFDGTQHRMYGFDKYALLDTSNVTGRFATKYDLSLKTSRSQTLSINGVTYNLSANRSWTVGDVMSSSTYSNPSWLSSLSASKVTGLSNVATSGSYNDLNGLPNLNLYYLASNPANYIGLSSLTWANISGKPSFTTVATSGLYSDLSGLPVIPTNNNQLSNGAGYLTSFTEVDPTVPSYSKSLSAFSVIKSSTDPLYKPIGYAPSNAEVLAAIGYTPYNGTTNPNGYISSVPAQSFSSLTGKPTTLSGYGITDAYPLSGNPSGFLTGITSGQVVGALGFTPVTSARTLTINGTTQDLSANRTWTVGDVTTSQLNTALSSYALISSLSNYVTNSSLSSTLSGYSTTSALTSGLSSKQNSVTLTTTGSGAATFDQSTGALNIPTGTSYTQGTGIGIASGVISNTAPYVAPVISTPTMVLGTSYQAPANKNIWVNASIQHTIALTLVLSSGSSSVQLQTSPNNSTWTTINSCGFSDAVAIAVALNKTVTNNVSGEVPPNFYYRLVATTSGAGSAAIVNQQLKTY